jgi:cytochrome c oxidase assembly protein subunit 11
MTEIHFHRSKARRQDLFVAAACGTFVALMVGMAYAAVPLYNWFCRATGFGGTTQVAASAPSHAIDRKIVVRFDANVGSGLPWKFEPEVTAIETRLGEVVTVNYRVTNASARETVGQASYNVTPPTTGIHFQKVNCFCFVEQRLRPGEKRDMPVVFYIDPALAEDTDAQGVSAITLSYTFFAVRQPDPAAGAGEKRAGLSPRTRN